MSTSTTRKRRVEKGRSTSTRQKPFSSRPQHSTLFTFVRSITHSSRSSFYRIQGWITYRMVSLCYDPTVGPESLTLFLSTLLVKGVFSPFPLTVGIFPLSFCITMLLIPDYLICNLLIQSLLKHKVDTENTLNVTW